MAAKPPKVNIRGIRASMPQGYLLGRLDKGFGPAQLISLRELQTFIQSVANSDVLPADVQFSTNHRILARNTAGAGPGEELTIDTILDWIGSAQGDILFRDASVWNVLAPTTDGYLLTTHGAAANPTWTAPPVIPSAITIKDEGATLTATPTSIDFVGAGVVATAVGNAVTVTIAGGSGSSAGMLPLVSGDLPGPSLIADAFGQCIGVPL
jgi:hypothetical protein